ncbi:MAG: SIR2 family protein [Candidatus Cloacimonetes bacterium]|nr:SIR2 family protein [Candidatus Cloacimonadota bacterium]
MDIIIDINNYYSQVTNKIIYESALKNIEKELKMDRSKLVDLFNITILYCRSMIAELLSEKWIKDDLSYLNILKDINKQFGQIDIFSLNHDLVLEKYFKSVDISYNDGLKKLEEKVYCYDVDYYFPEIDISLYKLHGSVNWIRFGFQGKDTYGIINDEIKYREYEIESDIPEILTGTNNKFIQYQRHIFADLKCKFKEKCNEAGYLIISGYGFNDAGVNYTLINAMDLNPEMKIIIIDRNYCSFFKDRNGYVTSNLTNWHNINKLYCIDKWFQDVSIEDIRGYICME